MSRDGRQPGETTTAPHRRAPADARRRAAIEIFARHEETLRRTARRYSLCADDVDDALQRALEIVLTKAPTEDPRELIRWTQTVAKHEALAVRRDRERILAPASPGRERSGEDWTATIPASSVGPAERVERRETIARSREALKALKPDQLRALTLLAEGYSYVEIGRITGFSQTKINRCLAEGRERFRKLVTDSEDGSRCAELRPRLSALCDGRVEGREAEALREHLRACAGCRATLRAYRAAPHAAAALLPALPAGRSLLDRAHEALAGLASRLPGQGGGDPGLSQAAAAGGARGAGAAALAKVLAICAGTAGGAACVAAGLVPAPLELPQRHSAAPRVEGAALDPATVEALSAASGVAYEPAPEPPAAAPQSPEPEPQHSAEPVTAPAPEPVPDAAAGAVEYAPEATAAPSPPPTSAPSGGGAAGEFGP